MRVISPPRDSTPAILQAVRGSWPSRRRESATRHSNSNYVATNVRLSAAHAFTYSKVAQLFLSGSQEDTFAIDSLQHIMNLLESLNSHAFTLLASLTLSGDSRAKDLWIFTRSSDEPQEDIKAIGDTALPDTSPTSLSMGSDADSHHTHTEAATMPFPGANARTTGHARSASEGTHQSLSSGRLRESHFDSGFPWKSLSPRMRISSPIQGSPELEHTEAASSGSSTIPMTRSSYVSRDYTIGNRFSLVFDVQSSADLV